MALDLGEYTDVLLREITPLGTTVTADTSTLIEYLLDAFWEAKLDGFFPGHTADDEGTIVPIGSAADLDRTAVALMVLFAGVKVLRNRILNTKTTFRAKAGAVEFEQGTSAAMLVEMLKQLQAMKKRILDQVDNPQEITGVIVLDAYSARLFQPELYHGSPELI